MGIKQNTLERTIERLDREIGEEQKNFRAISTKIHKLYRENCERALRIRDLIIILNDTRKELNNGTN